MKQQEIELEEKLMHVKFNYPEAITSRRELLETERHLLKAMIAVNNYRKLRMMELKLKIRLQKKLREFGVRARKLQTTIPQIKVPKKLSPKRTALRIKKAKTKHEDSLESELREIQEKLQALQQ